MKLTTALLLEPSSLPDMYHNSLMKAVESDGGQSAEEFADFIGRQTFPDGTNMLAMMHNDNYIKKFKTKEIMVTYGPGPDGRILLNKLNEMIAKDKGVKVSELAIDPDAPAKATATKVTKKADAKNDNRQKISTWVQLTKDFVSEWRGSSRGITLPEHAGQVPNIRHNLRKK